jgi:hypothetical protein
MVIPTVVPRRDAVRASRTTPRSSALAARLRVLTVAVLALGAAACEEVTEPSPRPEAPSVVGVRRDLSALGTPLDRAHWADGYAWANNPTGALYNPSSFYAFNRLGNAITIRKPAGSTGRYIVKFTGLSALLGSKSTLHVTGYLGDNHYCKPVTPTLVADSVDVRCVDGNTLTSANSYFTVLATRSYGDLAFAYAHLQTGNNYAPQGSASWNPAGSIRVFRNGVGSYSVRFNNLGTYTGTNGGHVQVSAVGIGQQHCKVGGWGGSPNLSISVLCFGGAGVPRDTPFNVLFLLPADHLAYAWADQPSSASYTPSTFYSWNPAGGAINISRTGTGRYNVSWTGADPAIFDGGDVQVTAYGGGATQCKVEGGGSASATVRCFAPHGALVDSFFDVLLGS